MSFSRRLRIPILISNYFRVIKAFFLLNGKAFLCHSDAWWHISGQDGTSFSSRTCQHSWKVSTFTRSKTPSADQRRFVHHSCTAERRMHRAKLYTAKLPSETMNCSWFSSLGQFQARLSVLLFPSLLQQHFERWITTAIKKRRHHFNNMGQKKMHNIVSSRRGRSEELRRCLIWTETQTHPKMPTV